MKKAIFFAAAVVCAVATSCGGGATKSVRQANVSLDELDDYCTVTSCAIESDAKDKGLDNLDKVRGTLTIVVKRNDTKMKYKPSEVYLAYVYGDYEDAPSYVFGADCEAAVKKIIKMEPGSEETFAIGFTAIDPYTKNNSDEENANFRKNAYEVLTNKVALDQIIFEIDLRNGDLDDDDEDDSDEDDEEDVVKEIATNESGGSSACDKFLDEYANFATSYVTTYKNLYKKSAAGDLSVLADIQKLTDEVSKFEQKYQNYSGSMTQKQQERYYEITLKIANALVD